MSNRAKLNGWRSNRSSAHASASSVKIGTRSLGQCRITMHIAATGMIARSAPSPSSPAPSARRYAALGLDRSARPSKRATMPQMRTRRCSPVLKIHARQTTSDRSSAGFLTSGHLVLWNKRLLMASQRRHNGGSREKAARRPGERPCRSDAWRSCAGSGELAPEVDHARVL